MPIAISLLGPFAVRASDGSDLTPRSQKACAILAILCESADLRCTRAALQDKLWSDRDQTQGATSLRQALSEIRRALGPYRQILMADMRMVALDASVVTVDIADRAHVAQALARGLVYLDGIGVRDPEFDDWLRDRRSALENIAQPPASGATVPTALSVHRQAPEMPVLHLSAVSTSGPAMFAEHILHAVGRGVAEAGAVDVRFGFDPQPGRAVFLLEVGERELPGGTALHVRLVTVPGNSICWQKSEILAVSDPATAGASLSRLINQCIDGTMAAFGGFRPFGRLPPKDPSVSESAATLHRMWASAGSNPAALVAELQESFDRYGRGVDLAWQAFLWCFIVGERRESIAVKFEARRLIRQALEVEPNNSLILALGSHVYGFVLREFEVSLDMAERSVRLDQNNVLGWTFLGIARVNMGQLQKGYVASAHARKIAGEGPYRDFIDGVAAMTACLTGRFEESVMLGEATTARRPAFAAPLRYLIASYLLDQDFAKAEIAAHRLREIEPDFEMRLLSEPDYPVEPLRRSGLIDLRKMPLLT